jgi:hypothetical protein
MGSDSVRKARFKPAHTTHSIPTPSFRIAPISCIIPILCIILPCPIPPGPAGAWASATGSARTTTATQRVNAGRGFGAGHVQCG